jgi:hypothetical protein
MFHEVNNVSTLTVSLRSAQRTSACSTNATPNPRQMGRFFTLPPGAVVYPLVIYLALKVHANLDRNIVWIARTFEVTESEAIISLRVIFCKSNIDADS